MQLDILLSDFPKNGSYTAYTDSHDRQMTPKDQ
jgi:hypothetical protein